MISSSARRVVITGMGLVSPLGNTQESLWDALSNKRSGVGRLESIPSKYLPTQFGAEAREFTGHINDFGPLSKELKRTIRKSIKVMCREIQMGVAAAQLALTDSRLELEKEDSDRIGVVYGSDYMMTLPDEFIDGVTKCLDENRKFQFERWAEEGLPQVTPLWLLKYLPNMPASHIAIYNDLRGPNNSITIREAAANLALGEAFCTIERDGADVIVAGATGTRIHPMRSVHVALQEKIATNFDDPTKLSRPYELNRSGVVLGEGAGTVVLELLERALERGATIWGELVGFGSSAVIDRQGHPQSATALKNAINQALSHAEMKPEEIGHIHGHGLGTLQSDQAEAEAIQSVFGELTDAIPVTAAKSYFGNLGAGSAMIELIASLLSFKYDTLFPVLNYAAPDPDCPLAVARSGQSSPGNSVLNLSFTPQGQASAVIVRKFENI